MTDVRTAVLALCLSAYALLTAGPLVPTTAAQPAGSPSASPDSTLPDVDPDVRTGTLDNGLRYFVRQNDEPKDRLVLRLAVNAGSVLEGDDEEGIAHFLEHMLFNGTERFEEQELIDFLERTGMEFGPDVNAGTSFDQTVYKLLLPTDTTGLVETGVDVLAQWAEKATLRPEAIENEKGVVLSEYRSRYESAQGRLFFETYPTLLAGSRYADRLPIGDTTDIRAYEPEQVRGFYEDWYRPNLMAVVAVGDADPDTLERLIRERFSGMTNPSDAPERPSYEVPGHDSTQYAVVTDPENPVSVVRVHHKTDARTLKTVGNYRRETVTQLFYNMLNSRLDEKARAGTVPFLSASGSKGRLVRTEDQYVVGAQVPDDSVAAGLEGLLKEVTRVRKHGFTATELARAKQNLLTRYENAYRNRTDRSSDAFAGEYVNLFLSGDAAPGIAYEYDLIQSMLPEITLSDVNARAETLFDTRNRVVIVQMPEKEDVTPPSASDLAAALDRAADAEVEPYEDDASDVPLMASTPEPASVTDRASNDSLGTTTFTLSNGVRVVVKPTDFKQNEVQFVASSPGGLSLVPDSTYASAQFANALVTRSGVGAFTQTALEKKLAGKTVSVSPYVSDTEEGLRGSAAPADLETMFQLVHLYVTEPRADSSALASFQRRVTAYLQNRSKQPSAVFQDSLRQRLYGDDPRRQTPSVADVEGLEAGALLDAYRDRFADLSDLTFTVVGNVSVDSVETLARTYLGTLPGGEGETAVDAQPNPPDERVEMTVNAGVAQRSRVLLLYHGPMTYDRENRHRLRALQDYLSIRLREELRENRSGVYGVDVGHSTSGAPDPRYSFSVSFIADPPRAKELTAAARAVVDSVRNGHVDPETVAKVKQQQRRSRETSLEENGFWVSALDFTYTTEGEDPMDIFRYDALIDATTPDRIATTARDYLNTDRMVEATLYPEGFTPASGASGESGSSGTSGESGDSF